ncbi:hypothetical protein ABZY04_23350, partial [Streptomyces sp. NPDC002922]
MTATTGTDDGRDERAELARLLPPATGFDLPPGRHEHHRERLMNLIDDDADRSESRGQERGLERAVRADRP